MRVLGLHDLIRIASDRLYSAMRITHKTNSHGIMPSKNSHWRSTVLINAPITILAMLWGWRWRQRRLTACLVEPRQKLPSNANGSKCSQERKKRQFCALVVAYNGTVPGKPRSRLVSATLPRSYGAPTDGRCGSFLSLALSLCFWIPK